MKQTWKTALMWCLLLTKRLYKKATFLTILVLIPLVAFGYSGIDTDDSGIITIALSKEASQDALADQLIEELQSEGQLIRYTAYDDPERAIDAVRAGHCDAAWVFVADLQSAVYRYGEHPDGDTPLVSVYERQENVALMLSREQLEGKLFEQYAPYVYIHHARAAIPEMAQWTDEELLGYYDSTTMDNEALFEFAQVDIGGLKEGAQALHYLMTPVRGLLGIVIMLCGLATAMYYITDSRRGTFSWMPESRRPFAELGCQTVAVVQVSAVSMISLVLVGLGTVWWRELLVAVLGTLCTAVFSMMLRRMCGSLRALGTLLPLLVVVTLLVCPVFFDLKELGTLQYLFPPSYYINAVYNDFWLLITPLYIAACAAVYWLFGRLFNRT